MKIATVSIDRPVFTTMVAAAAMVLGVLSLFRLSVDLFPEVSFPVVSVSTVYRGASPEEIEQQVTRTIEDAVSSVNGVDTIRSYSRDSVSVVVVLFNLGVDTQRAASDVRDKLQAVKNTLPAGADDPQVSKMDPSAQPIMIFSVQSDGDATHARRLVDDVVRPALETVEGVGSIDVRGGSEREIRVELDQTKLQALNLSVTSIAQLLRAESFDLPGGKVIQGGRELAVKAQGRFQAPQEVADTVLMALADGTQIRVSDVGTVKDTVEEVRELVRIDGKDAVTFTVMKQSGGNTIKVSEGVHKRLEKLQSRVASDVKFTLISEQAHFIQNNITRLREHLILGGVLAILVIFLFMLDVRSTLISAVSLPLSVIATFTVISLMGFTLNIMSMLGLTLSIGLLIDDSVVVRENIFRYLERGDNPRDAAKKGVSEIALAVFATTMTIVAVFVPVGFMGGLIGRFFKEFALTVAAAVLVSMVVSFTIDPMLSARLAQKVDADRHTKMRKHWFYGPPTRAFEALDDTYRHLLGWALSHRITVMGVAFAIFVASLGLPSLMGKEFFKRGDQGRFEAILEMQPGTPLQETDRIAREAEKLIKIPECPTIFARVGVDRDVAKASLQILCVAKDERTRDTDQFMVDARKQLESLPGAKVTLRIPDLANNGVPAAVSLLVTGPDFDELQRTATEAYEILRATPGAVDVSISARPGSPEQRFVVNRSAAADRGVSFAAAAQGLRAALEGDVVATMPDGNKDIDIRVQLRAQDRATVELLQRILIPSRSGALVHLADVVTLVRAQSPAVIERTNRERSISVTANLNDRSLGDVLNVVNPQLDKLMKPGFAYKYEGDAENMKDTFANMLIALALAVVFIYFVLASQFESFAHPFTIMLALPLAIVGALLALFLTGQSLGMPSMIGIILLMGLVTKNGILLVDYTNQLRARGKTVMEALLEAGPARLRPILMTSAAIVLGELPTALSKAEGAEFNGPMAVAVIGGVITSTLLTLVVVPVAYVWVDKISTRADRSVTPAAE